jgi:hypothetical protein
MRPASSLSNGRPGRGQRFRSYGAMEHFIFTPPSSERPCSVTRVPSNTWAPSDAVPGANLRVEKILRWKKSCAAKRNLFEVVNVQKVPCL